MAQRGQKRAADDDGEAAFLADLDDERRVVLLRGHRRRPCRASPSQKIPQKRLIAAMDDPCDCFLARWTNCRTAFTGNGGEIKTAKFQV